MSDRDFFREVDEAVRQDRYRELWDKYGLYALVAAALIVAGVAGFKAWTYWQERSRKRPAPSSARPWARSTAAMPPRRTAHSMTWRRRDRPAIACWRASRSPPPRRKPAIPTRRLRFTTRSQRIRATDNILKGLCHDSGGYAPARHRRLRGDGAAPQRTDRAGEPLEIFGAGAARAFGLPAEQDPDAEKQFSALIADQGTPQNLRERADMMLALIVGKPQALSTTAK